MATCKQCGSSIQDNTTVCPFCGTFVGKRETGGYNIADVLKVTQEEEKQCEARQRLALGPVKSLFWLCILSLLQMIVIAGGVVFFIKTTLTPDAGSYEYGQTLESIRNWELALGIAAILIDGFIVKTVFSLREIEPAFGNAGVFGLALIALNVIGLFWNVGIFSVIFQVLFTKQLVEGMGTLCRPKYRKLSSSWARYFTVFLVSMVVSFFIGLFYSYRLYTAVYDSDALSYLCRLLIVAAVISAAMMIYQIKLLADTKKAFRQQSK